MRRRRFPFFSPFFEDVEDLFDRLFNEWEKEIQRDWEAWKREAEELQKRGAIVRGVKITVGPDGKPVVETFGNLPEKPEYRRPLVEVNEKKDGVEVIAEMPGAEKDKIQVKVRGEILQLSCKDPPYYAEVKVGEVDPNSAKATYKNGILRVEFKRKKEPETEIKIS